jgi:hypothetical protein
MHRTVEAVRWDSLLAGKEGWQDPRQQAIGRKKERDSPQHDQGVVGEEVAVRGMKPTKTLVGRNGLLREFDYLKERAGGQ